MLFSSPSLGYGAQAPEGWIYRVPTRHIHYLSASLVFHSHPPPYSYSYSSSHSILLLLHTHTQAGSDILAKSFADYPVATICQDWDCSWKWLIWDGVEIGSSVTLSEIRAICSNLSCARPPPPAPCTEAMWYFGHFSETRTHWYWCNGDHDSS